MSDRFISPCPPPNPYEAELLTILVEECAEVQQRATKLLRFGRDEIEPGQSLTNSERLAKEIGDFLAVFEMVSMAGLVNDNIAWNQRPAKRAKLEKFLQNQPSE